MEAQYPEETDERNANTNNQNGRVSNRKHAICISVYNLYVYYVVFINDTT